MKPGKPDQIVDQAFPERQPKQTIDKWTDSRQNGQTVDRQTTWTDSRQMDRHWNQESLINLLIKLSRRNNPERRPGQTIDKWTDSRQTDNLDRK